MTLHALTIWQPWASAIVLGPKRFENRAWSPKVLMPEINTNGAWIAIHAGKTFRHQALDRIHDLPGAEHLPRKASEYPCGAIIGLARIVRVHEPFKGPVNAWRDWSYYAWEFDQVEVLSRPLPERGERGLWQLSTNDMEYLINDLTIGISLRSLIESRMPEEHNQ